MTPGQGGKFLTPKWVERTELHRSFDLHHASAGEGQPRTVTSLLEGPAPEVVQRRAKAHR